MTEVDNMMTLKKKVLCGLMAAALMSPTASYAAEVVEEAPAQHQTASMVQSEEQGENGIKERREEASAADC